MVTEYSIGQIWKNRRNKPTSTFSVLRIYERKYASGDSATRVKGVLITGNDGCGTHLRDLDSRSVEKMFPFLLFAPPHHEDEEDK